MNSMEGREVSAYSESLKSRMLWCDKSAYSLPWKSYTLVFAVLYDSLLSNKLFQLLTKSCYPPANGHAMVSEALSTLRLRYGEPVRFRFLVGMLQSTGGSGDLQAAGLAFINALLCSAPTPQRKLYIQAELEQAGFDIVTLKKVSNNVIYLFKPQSMVGLLRSAAMHLCPRWSGNNRWVYYGWT